MLRGVCGRVRRSSSVLVVASLRAAHRGVERRRLDVDAGADDRARLRAASVGATAAHGASILLVLLVASVATDRALARLRRRRRD